MAWDFAERLLRSFPKRVEVSVTCIENLARAMSTMTVEWACPLHGQSEIDGKPQTPSATLFRTTWRQGLVYRSTVLRRHPLLPTSSDFFFVVVLERIVARTCAVLRDPFDLEKPTVAEDGRGSAG